MTTFFICLLGSYLLGSVPFGLVMAKVLRGVDLRTVGSGNIGATNAMRVLGKPLGLVAFLLDFGKGLLPSWLPSLLVPAAVDAINADVPLLFQSLCGTAAVVGHCFPVYLRFHGGKGVATGCGAIVGVDPIVFVASGLVWLASLLAFRFVSLASMAMGVAFPIAAYLRLRGAPAFAVACGLLTLLVLVRHRKNIARIRAGTEPRVGAGKRPVEGPGPESPPSSTS